MDFSEAWAQANQAAQAISTDAVRYSTKYGLREGVDPDFMDKLKDDYAPSTPASSYSPPTSINTGKTVEEEWTSFGDPVAQHQGAVTSVCLAERREEGPCIYTGGMDGKVPLPLSLHCLFFLRERERGREAGSILSERRRVALPQCCHAEFRT